ncbi:hypothetical protein ABK040_000729 [Willaertia magna]
MSEERVLKKRKVEFTELLFSSDAIIEITKFIDEIKDYFNLSLINKSMFDLMMKENLHSLNEIFKRNLIILNENFPDYLFHLNHLNIKNQKENLQLLQNFKNLKYLELCNCEFEDEHLQHLNMLEELNLIHCNNILGEYINEFKQLKTLKLSNLKNIKSLPNNNNITTLTIKYCDNINIELLQNFTQTTKLTYKGTSSSIIAHLNSLQNLKYLTLTIRNDTKNYSLLLNLNSLESLKIKCKDSGNYLEDTDLINLPKLRTLHLLGIENNITGSCFINLKNLQNLYISKYEFEFEEENLQYLTNLKTFKCKGVQISAYYLHNLMKLKNLTFIPNNEFKEEYLKDLILLKRLKINGGITANVSKFTGNCLTNLTNLTELIIPHSKVEDKYLMELTKLEVLDLSCCKTVTGECLLNLTNLQILNISETNIEEKYLQNLLKLSVLNIKNCFNIVTSKYLLQLNQLKTLYCDEWFKKTDKELYIKDKEITFFSLVIREKDNIIKSLMEEKEEKENEIKQLKMIIEQLQKKVVNCYL